MRWTPLKRTLIRGVGILSLTSIVGCAHEDAWTRQDTKHFSTYVAAASIDSYSTYRLLEMDPFAIERNSLIVGVVGERPSAQELFLGTVVVATINYFVARSLPYEYRRKYLGVWTFGHSTFAISNAKQIHNYEPKIKKNPFEDAEPWR